MTVIVGMNNVKIIQLKPQLTSEFQVFHLDDGTLGGGESRSGDWAATE